MIKIRFVDKCLIITTKDKPVKGDWMCGLQVGYTNKLTGKVVIPRKRFICFYDDSPASRLNSICSGTEKIIFKIGNPK